MVEGSGLLLTNKPFLRLALIAELEDSGVERFRVGDLENPNLRGVAGAGVVVVDEKAGRFLTNFLLTNLETGSDAVVLTGVVDKIGGLIVDSSTSVFGFISRRLSSSDGSSVPKVVSITSVVGTSVFADIVVASGVDFSESSKIVVNLSIKSVVISLSDGSVGTSVDTICSSDAAIDGVVDLAL